ncbi:DUF4190 domain-containing protein [Serinicoccus kebangsaanensis]|uniref:DUF4190 domain-containing protein n=1 Tax=Serinicoccus kebangsaanensis TaxID=2602069 RepID=UPI00124CC271|nr:DUF4190 domain-containing protein [Serinicoccus kebangsaanensis]
MFRFEPPPAPRAGGGSEPEDPYAAQPAARSEGPTATDPYARPPGGPWGPQGTNIHPRGTVALVLGILSCCGMAILGPVAWAIAHASLREAQASPYPVTNLGHLTAARILGMVGTGMLALSVAWFLVVISFAISTA